MTTYAFWHFCVQLVCISSVLAFGEDQDLDPLRVLQRAAKRGSTLADGPHYSRLSILTEIAGLQAALGDEPGSRDSVEEAVKAGGPPPISSSVRNDIRRNVLFAKVEGKLRLGALDEARIALSEIRQLEVQNSSPQPFQTLERVAEMQFRAKDLQGARATAKAIQSKAEALPITSNRAGRVAGPQTRASGMAFAARVFHTIAEADLAKQARDQAQASEDIMADRSQRVDSLARLLEARAGDGDIAGAMDQLNASGDLTLDGDQDAEFRLLAAIAIGAAEKDVAAALATASHIRDPLRRFDAILTVARRATRAGRWQAALTAWEAVNREAIAGSTRNFLADLALAQARMGRLDDARRTASQALREASRPGGEEFYHQEFPSPYFYTRIAESFWLMGDRESAGLYLRQAQELIDKSDLDRARKSIALNGVAGLMALMGRLDEALQILSKSSVLDRDALSTVIGDAASSRLKNGDPAGANKLIDFLSSRLQNSWQVAEVVKRVAMLEARDGDAKRSIRWADSQISEENKTSALLGAARGLVEKRPTRP